MELKSASTSSIVPDTCVPTSTVVTGCSTPVTTMRRTMSPTVTGAEVTWMSTGPRSDWSVQRAVAISGKPMNTATRVDLDRIGHPPALMSTLDALCFVRGVPEDSDSNEALKVCSNEIKL